MHHVAVVGLGPAGRALASRCAVHGASVLAVDPRPEALWTPTYGVWEDELGDLPPSVVRHRVAQPMIRARSRYGLARGYVVLDNAALQEALPLDGVEVRRARLSDDEVSDLRSEATVVVDARGARPSGPVTDDQAAAQTAYGIVVTAEAARPALQGAEALLMDWQTDWSGRTRPRGPASFLYAMPLGEDRVLLEETCLAAAPPLPVAELAVRLRTRLLARGVDPRVIEEPLAREVVRIPMRGRDAPPPAGALAVGVAGRGGHLVTGYSVAHSLAGADDLARAIVAGDPPAQVDPEGPADVVREVGLRALLRLDVNGTIDLFEAFGRLPASQQRDFMSRSSHAPALTRAMWGMFAQMPLRARAELVRATAGSPWQGLRLDGGDGSTGGTGG